MIDFLLIDLYIYIYNIYLGGENMWRELGRAIGSWFR